MDTAEIITLIVAIIAIGISIWSTRISNASKKIANEALETSKYQFLQLNRPWINLSAKRFENGMFWEVAQKGNQVEILFNYVMKNVGNVAAKNISFPHTIAVGPDLQLASVAPVIFEKPDQITLGPGDDIMIAVSGVLTYQNEEDAIKNLEHIISEESKGVTFQVLVNYENALDESMKYKTIMENKIHNDVVEIIKSEMVDLTSTEVK